MDQVAAMRAFVRVVEAGTFTRASDLLDMPKATVTKLIQALEAHLQTKLLNRTTRRVTVTPDGAAYYERVVRLLADLDELDGSMALSQASPEGQAAHRRERVARALLVIIPALPDFHARYPDIQIDIGVTDRPVDLIGGECRLRGARRASSPTSRSSRGGSAKCISSPARRPPISSATASRVTRPTSRATITWSAISSRIGPALPVHLRPRRRAIRSQRPLYRLGQRRQRLCRGRSGRPWRHPGAALHGAALISTPARSARAADWDAGTMPLHVVYPPNRHLSNKLRVFVDWMAELFARSDLMRRRR